MPPSVEIWFVVVSNNTDGMGPCFAIWMYSAANLRKKFYVIRSGATCDKRRGNEPLTVNPLKPETLATITYHHDGRIHADDPDINHDLNDTLGLNSSKTNLCANRAAAMRAMEQTILKSIARKKIDGNSTAKKNLCLKILKQYENQIDKKEEYLGVKLFKAHKFVAKFSA